MARGEGEIAPYSSGGAVRGDDELTEWLKKVYTLGKGKLTGIGLRRVQLDGENRISEWSADDLKGYSAEDMFDQVMKAADGDAKFCRGQPRYAVLAYKSGESTHFQRYTWRVDGGMDTTDGGDEGERPNEQGITQMLMRHTEASVRMSLTAANEIIRTLERQLREHAAQMQRMAQVHFSVLELQQKMMDRQNERAMDLKRVEAEEKRKATAFEKLAVLWPILAQKFMGGVGGKSMGTMFGEEQLNAVLQSLNEEQVTTIMGTLNMEQKASFIELYKAYNARRAHAVGEGPDPEKKKLPAAQAPAAAAPAAPADAKPAEESAPEPEEAGTKGKKKGGKLEALERSLRAVLSELSEDTLNMIQTFLPEKKRGIFLDLWSTYGRKEAS